jgi:uncharacterized coiled-coil DUF342 family protein
MEPASLTIEILEQIRDGIGETNARLEQTNARLDQTNARLDETNTRLDRNHGELRAELRDLRAEARAGFEVHGRTLVKLSREVHGLNDRCDNFLHGAHGDEHADLRARVARLEVKVG